MRRKLAGFARRRLGFKRGTSEGPFQPGGAMNTVHHTRIQIAAIYLRGDGLEIGALHQPLPIPPSARVKYVDRMSAEDLRKQYDEISYVPFVETDIIDNGEELRTIADESQDFVIANHFIEHCQNPVQTLKNIIRVLKRGGVLYLAVPDKRFTFDAPRPSTTLDHVMRDFSEGPAWSRRQHFEDWSRYVDHVSDDQIGPHVEQLLQKDYSIHFHVWEAADLLELVRATQGMLGFELELFLRNGFETIVILRKTPPTPVHSIDSLSADTVA